MIVLKRFVKILMYGNIIIKNNKNIFFLETEIKLGIIKLKEIFNVF